MFKKYKKYILSTILLLKLVNYTIIIILILYYLKYVNSDAF